ncbi:MAG: NAD(P)/FAD-dependent oxidoreductase [Deltaproteobacteria bacterium]|nr:NAD(P)/FAD-dependent oxidoreductase [Deltaproteobacteria bacterium]
MSLEHFDVLIVGAGLSGIGAAYHLQYKCPRRTYAILEGRDAIGGTWDLFRYPGIRSDSDMYTLGYKFKPWTNPKAIADGPSILAYVNETAREYGIDRRIRFGHWVKSASWSSETARWTVEAERGDRREVVRFTCNFLFMCSGYYDYEQGYTPEFAGREDFRGRVVHPQKWTEDIDFAGKRVVVIGSGATAVTLVPAMAETAAHVTMLQRSPTYMGSAPDEDRMANALRRWLPERVAYAITRWRNIVGSLLLFQFCKRWPERAKRFFLRMVEKELGAGFDVAKHFTPSYYPWDQRLCLVPNADLFKAMREGRASVVTDQIERFTANGIRLKSGEELPADLIVTATGLNLKFLGGMQVHVDGERIDPAEGMTYRGMMLRGVPNLAWAFGYTNASWTLRADLNCEYVCKLLNHMAEHGHEIARPELNDPEVQPENWMNLTSGYVQRSIHLFPKQGSKLPWKLYQNYALDLAMIGWGRIDDGAMQFGSREPKQTRERERAAA